MHSGLRSLGQKMPWILRTASSIKNLLDAVLLQGNMHLTCKFKMIAFLKKRDYIEDSGHATTSMKGAPMSVFLMISKQWNSFSTCSSQLVFNDVHLNLKSFLLGTIYFLVLLRWILIHLHRTVSIAAIAAK